jgi:uncharacterized protein (DUF1684 family)
MKGSLSVLLLASLLILTACSTSPSDPPVDPSYRAELSEWYQWRRSRLLSDTGYINLAGLFWLQEGTSSFGSDSTCDVIFPEFAPPVLGTFVRTDTMVTLQVDPQVEISIDGNPVESRLLKTDMNPDEDAPTIMEWDSLRWYIIRRQNRIGVRLRDLNHPDLQTFPALERYPINPTWRIRARLQEHEKPVRIAVPNIIGIVMQEPSPGRLEFEIDGQTYHLDPTGNPGGRLFVVFSDQTTGRETYGGGRFLYADPPDSTGHTILDFNRAYNPPCAFTPYTTCPQPPAQNRLAIAVTAGEKMYRRQE